MAKKKIKLATLVGRGSRVAAIYKCCKNNPLVELVVVISDRKESPGIEFAKKKGIEAFYFRLSDWKAEGKTRQEFNLELARILKEKGVDFVIMAGWYVIMSNEFLEQFPKQVINLHPSLLPSFPGPGDKVLPEMINYGLKYAGTTIHFVLDESPDTGPIIFQKPVEIKPTDSPKTLAKKIGREEDKIICKVINWFARGKLKIKGRKVSIVDTC